MVRFVCDELLSCWLSECDQSDASLALRLLCTSSYRFDCSCLSSGVPELLRILTVCPLTALCDHYRRPSFARLSAPTPLCDARNTADGPHLAQLLACVLRPDYALLLSAAATATSALSGSECYYVCYLHDGDVCLERLSVDAVSESTRPAASEAQLAGVSGVPAAPPSNGALGSAAALLSAPAASRHLSSASASAASSLSARSVHSHARSSHRHQRSVRPLAAQPPTGGRSRQVEKQSDAFLRSLSSATHNTSRNRTRTRSSSSSASSSGSGSGRGDGSSSGSGSSASIAAIVSTSARGSA